MKLIVGNLKMNLDYYEINDYVEYFKDKNYSNVYFAPTSIYLSKFVDNGLNGVSQDVSSFEKGAYTGDVSAMQLKSMGVNYSLVGHSERRKNYSDNNFVNKKILQLLNQNIKPILCVGESYDERKNNRTFDVIKEEIVEAFLGLDKTKLANVIIAYEPVWAIGTGEIPTNDEIEEVISYIKEYVHDNYSYEVKVLYGGSVNNKCIGELEKIKNVDGYLVGGCSLNCDEFEKLINSID